MLSLLSDSSTWLYQVLAVGVPAFMVFVVYNVVAPKCHLALNCVVGMMVSSAFLHTVWTNSQLSDEPFSFNTLSSFVFLVDTVVIQFLSRYKWTILWIGFTGLVVVDTHPDPSSSSSSSSSAPGQSTRRLDEKHGSALHLIYTIIFVIGVLAFCFETDAMKPFFVFKMGTTFAYGVTFMFCKASDACGATNRTIAECRFLSRIVGCAIVCYVSEDLTDWLSDPSCLLPSSY